MSTPIEDYMKKKFKEAQATEKMQHDLDMYGKKVSAGRMWTVGDMQAYFRDSDAKKRKKKKVK